MLPFPQRVAFLLFACFCIGLSSREFLRVWQLIRAGRSDTDARTNLPARRLWYSLKTTLLQSRTFRSRPVVSSLHSWIFYGFVFYLLVNLVDAVDGFYPVPLQALGTFGRLYTFAADVLSALVIAAVVALIFRRFFSISRNDFRFNDRTLLHENVQRRYIGRDSLIVSLFILFHVGSRALEMGAKLRVEGPDHFQPFATLLSYAVARQQADALRIFGYWGALGSVLAFLIYFPYSKHIHIFMAPLKYAVAREVPSGVLPEVVLDIDVETETLGAKQLDNLAWPRLLDAYACIQCNRCQDVCPATATGKSLSPSALEINKRMELNDSTLATLTASARPLLAFALTPEAAWACTTCGACMQVCPVQDEPMLDIIDIRREQVMMEGKFPALLQSAFRGMERARNPWGIAQESRLAWAKGLSVPTVDENPNADVLYWVGCAASYDPQAQKTARALVSVLNHANVNFAVLGKKECCTGDSARRAGNEFLYRELAEQNVSTLNDCAPKLIIATCPHCMNSLGKEYPQLGGNYTVMHHTEFLDGLIKEGKLKIPEKQSKSLAFHDPCYLGRHNDVYDAPRSLLHVLSDDVREFGRSRETSFCCGAGGAQFWKEEEPGNEKISSNRMREARDVLSAGSRDKVVAVGCPFCKSMLQSTPQADSDSNIAVVDIAELLWESLSDGDDRMVALAAVTAPPESRAMVKQETELTLPPMAATAAAPSRIGVSSVTAEEGSPLEQTAVNPARAKWTPKQPVKPSSDPISPAAFKSETEVAGTGRAEESAVSSEGTAEAKSYTDPNAPRSSETAQERTPTVRAKWAPKKSAVALAVTVELQPEKQGAAHAHESATPPAQAAGAEADKLPPTPEGAQRKKWPGKKS